MNRREFLNLLACASASGLALDGSDALAVDPASSLYDFKAFGNVHVMHFTDCHAQLLPVYFREPNVNLGVADAVGRPPHLVGTALLNYFKMNPMAAPAGYARDLARNTAHAFTHIDFAKAAKLYGKTGGFAHLATLVKKLRAARPKALLLDGGDTWQGSATALWSRGQDMVDACKLLGVDVMTGHWEFTLGAKRVEEIVNNDFKGKIDFVAQNIKTADFGDPVFPPYVMKEMNGVPIAIIGQAFPYTPIANPRYMVAEWNFGIQEEAMQKTVNDARAKGAAAVILLSHNGMDVDIKMAARVTGIDAILGGHTHDGVPQPLIVKNASGQTLVTNAGSNTKFLGVLDLEVKDKRVTDFRYKLLPVFSNYLRADADMQAHIDKVRAPHKAKLDEKLAVTQDLLYRRGNFNGTLDQVILNALMETKNAPIAFSPGFRWGTSLLPGQAITMDHVMDQTAITYPYVTVNELSGEQIKTIMEDVCDNLFNPDPYYQQGGDMVRVGGMTYACDPMAKMGGRINDMRVGGKAIEADKKYKVAGWAPVSEAARDQGGEPIWDLVANYMRAKKVIKPVKLNLPVIKGMNNNPGIA